MVKPKSTSSALSPWAKDERGKVYGHWTVLEFARRDHRGCHWVCQCVCGKIKTVWGANLRDGHSKSCGCRRSARGMCRSPEYATWEAMKQRCYNPSQTGYQHYGGRGIGMCVRWRDSFTNFFDDMGPRPFPRATIDRIDNEGDYCPENCRWASHVEQGQNTRKTRRLTYKGETMGLRAWARRAGIAHGTLRQRLAKGWSLEQAITTPANPSFVRHKK